MQIENEYAMVEAAFREKGHSYVRWAAEMAVGLQTGVPWVMCKQNNAPDPVVSLQLFWTGFITNWPFKVHAADIMINLAFCLLNLLDQTFLIILFPSNFCFC